MSEHRFHGLELPVRSLPGARAIRVAHPAGQRIAPHRHDWPLLTLPILGGYCEELEDGAVAIDGPAAVLHPAGRCHANCIHDRGMETFSIEFDPAWLGPGGLGARLDRSRFRLGGRVSLASRRLARLWQDPAASDRQLRFATASFLATILEGRELARPSWLPSAAAMASAQMPTAAIARRLRLHPAWLARAYRDAAGEGLHETARRRRVERAVTLLRCSDEPIAEVAAAAGFCDQSHLNRAFAALLGRTPLQVRQERALLPLA